MNNECAGCGATIYVYVSEDRDLCEDCFRREMFSDDLVPGTIRTAIA